MEAHLGKPLHVPCSASGLPEPKIEWTKVEENGPLLGGELRFGAISQQDTGVYECRAKNGVEQDLVARTKLTVLGK